MLFFQKIYTLQHYNEYLFLHCINYIIVECSHIVFREVSLKIHQSFEQVGTDTGGGGDICSKSRSGCVPAA